MPECRRYRGHANFDRTSIADEGEDAVCPQEKLDPGARWCSGACGAGTWHLAPGTRARGTLDDAGHGPTPLGTALDIAIGHILGECRRRWHAGEGNVGLRIQLSPVQAQWPACQQPAPSIRGGLGKGRFIGRRHMAFSGAHEFVPIHGKGSSGGCGGSFQTVSVTTQSGFFECFSALIYPGLRRMSQHTNIDR